MENYVSQKKMESFKMEKENCHPRILYAMKTAFKVLMYILYTKYKNKFFRKKEYDIQQKFGLRQRNIFMKINFSNSLKKMNSLKECSLYISAHKAQEVTIRLRESSSQSGPWTGLESSRVPLVLSLSI